MGLKRRAFLASKSRTAVAMLSQHSKHTHMGMPATHRLHRVKRWQAAPFAAKHGDRSSYPDVDAQPRKAQHLSRSELAFLLVMPASGRKAHTRIVRHGPELSVVRAEAGRSVGAEGGSCTGHAGGVARRGRDRRRRGAKCEDRFRTPQRECTEQRTPAWYRK